MRVPDPLINLAKYILSSCVIIIPLIAVLNYISLEYCSDNKQKECIGISNPSLKIPNSVFGSLLGSTAGSILSYFAFSAIERKKNEREDRLRNEEKDREDRLRNEEKEDRLRRLPEIKAYFFDSVAANTEENKFENFVEVQEEHRFQTKNRKNYSIGKAFWVRVKVKNEGGTAAKQCRAYLINISQHDGVYSKTQGKGEWKNISGFSNSMPLLWAYERQNDYFIVGKGINFPSKSSYFFDVLAFYNPTLNVQSNKNNWFVKIKSKPHPHYHWEICPIEENKSISYKFNIEVYADECEVSKISIVAEHRADESKKFIYFYSLNGNSKYDGYRELPLKKEIFFLDDNGNESNATLSSTEIEEIYNDL